MGWELTATVDGTARPSAFPISVPNPIDGEPSPGIWFCVGIGGEGLAEGGRGGGEGGKGLHEGLQSAAEANHRVTQHWHGALIALGHAASSENVDK